MGGYAPEYVFHCIIENLGAGSQTDNGLQSDNCMQTDCGMQLDNGSQLDGYSKLGAHVGAPLRGRPINERWHSTIDNEHGHSFIDEHGQPTIDNEHGYSFIDEHGQPTIDDEHGHSFNDERWHSTTNDEHGHFIDENGRPMIDENGFPIIDECDQQNDIKRFEPNDGKYGLHNKKYNVTIGVLVDWFKTMTTNEYMRGVKYYGWKRFDGKLWQRNYYEHIIRSIDEYERIADYITDNLAKWQEDKFFK